MRRKRTTNAAAGQGEIEHARQKALELIKHKRTMVLATSMDRSSWAAPVYYLYTEAAFYFFSSPDALHTRQALSGTSSAAAIYADGNRLDQIEGVQITGAITHVKNRMEKLTATARYLTKFPMAKAFLGDPGAALDLSRKVGLFRFTPDKVYYMDNRSGFGRRLEIHL